MSENKEYVNDSFTKVDDDVNLEINNLNLSCMTSRNNKFNLDSEGNLTVKSINVLEGNTLEMQDIFNVVYPIGSIYMSTNEVNPGTLFGGSWERISGRFLLGAGTPVQNNYYSFGKIDDSQLLWNFENGIMGGEYKHKLSTGEMPNHNHNYYAARWMQIGYQGGGMLWGYSADSWEPTQMLKAVGEDIPHNNMPPYLVVSMWKRIA